MTLSSGDKIFLVSAVSLFISIATIAQTNEHTASKAVTQSISNAPADSPTFTATSTMSKKNAALVTNLLRNPHLKVKATAGKQAKKQNISASQPPISNPTYTASGTMSKKKAILLTNLLRNPHLKVKAFVKRHRPSNTNLTKAPLNSPTYTASGTMSKKTAVLLTNLLRNPHLKVKAEVGNKIARRASNPTEVTVNYTITGKTDRQTALKLKRLLKNSNKIKISAHATVNLPNRLTGQRTLSQQPHQFNHSFIGAYQPFYYNGRPPAYIQGNTIWYPVPVLTFFPNLNQAPDSTNNSVDIVNK